MSGPRLSGWCNNGQQWGHARCHLEGCTCTCHTPPPRVKVSLACLQGKHTSSCGHLDVDNGDTAGLGDLPDIAAVTKAYQQAAETFAEAFDAKAAALLEQPDGLDPPGLQLTINPTVHVDLTADEKRRIIAAHMILDPAAALSVVRTIIGERLTPTEGK